MKRQGFDYEEELTVAAQRELDFPMLVNPKLFLGNLGSLQGDGFGVNEEVLRRRRKTRRPADYESALYGTPRTPRTPATKGCHFEAQERYGDVSFESYLVKFGEDNESTIKRLVADVKYQQLQRQFRSCAKTEDLEMSDPLRLYAARFNRMEITLSTADLQSEKGLESALAKIREGDRLLVDSYKRCVRPLAKDLKVLVDAYLVG